jgi:hypothetical protein
MLKEVGVWLHCRDSRHTLFIGWSTSEAQPLLKVIIGRPTCSTITALVDCWHILLIIECGIIWRVLRILAIKIEYSLCLVLCWHSWTPSRSLVHVWNWVGRDVDTIFVGRIFDKLARCGCTWIIYKQGLIFHCSICVCILDIISSCIISTVW